ncbi:HNH endonuclease [Geitlerinema calcuttense]|uniref:HNH endonuclease n=1 Tax=Geitlerinema calcuttense NRMC-F 0142 TaxID=2922238 RepID=A0ABT7LWH4_9CYAN|nr:HNH endonuclease [Geitlerinema calcuttense]MDL5055907.1 HNH endonuclease [Geitlerinema calcuttense NRMC-F 0142]
MPKSEQWRIIADYPNYAVSSSGNVKRVVTNKYHPHQRVLRQAPDGYGYQIVTLYNPRQLTKKVHQLVMSAFVGPRPDGYEVNHKDGDKANNHLENLEYVTPAENKAHAVRNGLVAKGDRNAMRKYPERCFRIGQWVKDNPNHVRGESNPKAKLSESDVITIRSLCSEGGSTLAIARQYGVTPETIQSIKYRRTWKHI